MSRLGKKPDLKTSVVLFGLLIWFVFVVVVFFFFFGGGFINVFLVPISKFDL